MRRISHFKLGLFLLACAAAGAVAVIWVGAARIFESTKTYAAFFAQPVTGLDSGAPVRHLGIRVGNVDSVDLTAGDRLVRVLVKIRSGFRVDPSMALSVTQPGITGSPFLALEETPADERTQADHPPTKYPVLPTRPGGGGIAGAMQGIEKVVADAQAATEGLRRIAAAGPHGQPSQVEEIVRDLRSSAQSLKVATAAVSRQVDGLRPGTAAQIATRIERAADVGESAVRNIDENVGASAALLRQDLAQLRQAVVEAQSLARSLRADPGRLIEQRSGTDPFRR